MYPYTIAHSSLRAIAACTAVHRGGIVLSVAIRIKSKDLYTMRFCRIGVVCGPTHPERCSWLIMIDFYIWKKRGGVPLKPPTLPAAPTVVAPNNRFGEWRSPCAVGLRTHKPLFPGQPPTATVALFLAVMEVFFHTIAISHTHISLYMWVGCAHLAHTRELQCYIWLLLT